ncbi:flagellar filament capping protein FliD [Halomonas sp. PAMB 3264]|uniref:flagellar filament capping protein FliD n=1 Tax=Halomonas sp. PAMB 3264 TaxID=3075222 RepID=UPI0028A12CD6|nr:flagellar filament capping protein FliD [Halomonas sp. PAMB 3264]WNL41804.1 flagellar filament capping protein FliD [Halomonas sp. PAMB 3264]
MASISSLGIGSGLDLNGLLDQLQTAERAKLQPIAEQVQSANTTVSAYGALKSAVSTFQDATQALNDTSSFESLTTNVEGDGVIAIASSEAQAGRYDVEVDQLATAGSLVTERLDSADESVVSGEQTLSFALTEGSMPEITIADGSSLEDIRDAINDQGGGQVTASIINDGQGYRLSVMSSETGADASIESTNFSTILSGDGTTSDTQVVQKGQNAAFNVNGIDIVSASNQVEGAIQGMTLTLTEAGTSSTIKVEQDNEALRENVNTFVESFNTLKSTLNTLTNFDVETGQSGGLNADATTRAVERELRQAISGMTGGDGFNVLSDVGISLQTDGTLKVDDEKLDNVIATQPDRLAQFFAGSSEGGGMAGQINTSLERLVGDGGRLDTAKENAESRVESLQERYSRTEERIGQTVERYRVQFQAMDSMVAQMNQTGAYLEQQLGMLAQTNQS